MELQLDRFEAEWLERFLHAADEDLQRQIHHSDSREYRDRLERDAEIVQRIRTRLSESRNDDAIVDERSRESFPASDPP